MRELKSESANSSASNDCLTTRSDRLRTHQVQTYWPQKVGALTDCPRIRLRPRGILDHLNLNQARNPNNDATYEQ